MVVQFYTVCYIVKGHAVAVCPVVIVNSKIIAVKPYQPLRCTHPYKTTAVLHYIIYSIRRQAICHCIISKTYRRIKRLGKRSSAQKK